MLIACVLGTVSCASKKVANQQPPYPNYAGQPQPPQPKQTENGFTVIEESPIMLLSMDAPQGEIRAYGEGESPDSQLALNIAKSQAVAALQSQIETFVKCQIPSKAQRKVQKQYALVQIRNCKMYLQAVYHRFLFWEAG